MPFIQCFKPLGKRFSGSNVMIFWTQRQNLSNPTFGWFYHEKVKKLTNHTKMLLSPRSCLCFFSKLVCGLLGWCLSDICKKYREHQLTSKNRHSRAIVVTKILIPPPDDEQSCKMTSYDFYDFIFGFYGQNYVRNVPAGFSAHFYRSWAEPNTAGLPKNPSKKWEIIVHMT